jgi:hypothetical protein
MKINATRKIKKRININRVYKQIRISKELNITKTTA